MAEAERLIRNTAGIGLPMYPNSSRSGQNCHQLCYPYAGRVTARRTRLVAGDLLST